MSSIKNKIKKISNALLKFALVLFVALAVLLYVLIYHALVALTPSAITLFILWFSLGITFTWKLGLGVLALWMIVSWILGLIYNYIVAAKNNA